MFVDDQSFSSFNLSELNKKLLFDNSDDAPVPDKTKQYKNGEALQSVMCWNQNRFNFGRAVMPAVIFVIKHRSVVVSMVLCWGFWIILNLRFVRNKVILELKDDLCFMPLKIAKDIHPSDDFFSSSSLSCMALSRCCSSIKHFYMLIS